jgi:hypothetical protein
VLPEILLEEQNGEATVFALVPAERREMTVIEHGKDWRVRWSVANLTEYLEGKRRLTHGTFVSLPGPGIYQVVLEVEHLPTGALRSTHRQIPIAVPTSRNVKRRPFSQS